MSMWILRGILLMRRMFTWTICRWWWQWWRRGFWRSTTFTSSFFYRRFFVTSILNSLILVIYYLPHRAKCSHNFLGSHGRIFSFLSFGIHISLTKYPLNICLITCKLTFTKLESGSCKHSLSNTFQNLLCYQLDLKILSC